MKNINVKKLLPHIIALAVFVIVAVIFCKPALEGKVLNQGDTISWRGMAQQSFDVKAKTGHFPLWTNSMFGGMPTYQIAFDADTNIGAGIVFITKAMSLGLPEPISFFFLACLCFYILSLVMKANPWMAMLGALAYAYSTYDPVIITAGHITKMLSLDYAPLVIAGIVLLFNKKYLAGFAVTATFTAILIGQNHLQIVYYTLLTVAVMCICYFIQAIKQKETMHAIKASVFGLVAGLVGLGACASIMLPTYEYAKESIRGGKSELTILKPGETQKNAADKNTKGGLDPNYAFKWSISPMETFTVMVPGIVGGSNGGKEHTSSSINGEEIGLSEENTVGITNGYSYWGMSNPGAITSGPNYIGALICFLFIFSLVYIKGWQKWWLISISVIGILLAWGSNLKGFNVFMLEHLPFYNKFRAPSMSMVLLQFAFPLLAVLGLSKLVDGETDWAAAWKKFRISLIATGAALFIVTAFYFTASYTGIGDKEVKERFLQQMTGGKQQVPDEAVQQVNKLMNGIREDRKSLAGGDLARSLLFIALGVALVGLFIKRKINALILSIGLILATTIDLIGVDKRYIAYDDFKEVEEVDGAFNPSPADIAISQQPDHANFRVFNMNVDFTNEAITAYHHNSIGGYHAAKLSLYQDLLEYQIFKQNRKVFDMLNTKWIIGQDQKGNPVAEKNDSAYGNCWLVKGVKFVPTADAEMIALDSTNLRDTAVVRDTFKTAIKELPQYDSTASIKVVLGKDGSKGNDKLTYDFNASKPQFAVMSEIYYDLGWNAYIDGKKVDYVKTDYALRGLYVPAGKHSIDFVFEPTSVSKGRSITIWSTILIYLSIVLAFAFPFIRRKDHAVQA